MKSWILRSFLHTAHKTCNKMINKTYSFAIHSCYTFTQVHYVEMWFFYGLLSDFFLGNVAGWALKDRHFLNAQTHSDMKEHLIPYLKCLKTCKTNNKPSEKFIPQDWHFLLAGLLFQILVYATVCLQKQDQMVQWNILYDKREILFSENSMNVIQRELYLYKQGMLTTFPQYNFSLDFPKILSKNHKCYHGLSKILTPWTEHVQDSQNNALLDTHAL